ncbi:alginate export family protein [Methylobacillus glycogenes]|uniref:alginate export family protein n=1 Tax=Methylobacillus glycogenes TaxID=406 RepID=UPI000471D5FB|nr:alginate export family protein [Methylobacillus glycogenes]
MQRIKSVFGVLGFLALGGGGYITTAQANDGITPINPATGQVLVPPAASALAEDATAGKPNPKSVPYTLLRYNERYSYLANPVANRDFFDPVKYISLDENDPERYLSFGGEVRERYERFHNQNFGVRGPASNDFGLQRIMVHADLHLTSSFRIFAQGISGVQFGGANKAPVNQNPLDLQQAFADYTWGDNTPNGDRFTLRGGRFSMAYGSSRLVATRAATNIPLKFDGVQFIASSGGNSKVYGFLTRPVEEQRYRPDRANPEQLFGGLYISKPVNSSLSIDAYYLGYRDEGAQFVDASGTEIRHSVGGRFFGKLDNWDYDLEPVFQWGKIADKDILAWTLAADAGYTFKQHPWKPRLGVKFDVASGDRNQGDDKVGTFNPLFFKAGYFNDASLLRPANITDLHFSWQAQPLENLTVTLGHDIIWRFSRNDAVYATNGAISLPAQTSNSSRYVGSTIEAAAQWKINRHLVATASYVHMYTSDYVESAGGADVDYAAAWVSYLW